MRTTLPTGPASTIETLQGLLDRLSAPDLTATEALELHPRLFRLLESIESSGGRAGSGDADGRGGRRPVA